MVDATAERGAEQAFIEESGWMKEADHYLMGQGLLPVPWKRFVEESERRWEAVFKAIEQRKVPEDQGRLEEETVMGAAMVVWNSSMVTPFRRINWASSPMALSGKMLDRMFRALSGGVHVELVLETPEVHYSVMDRADIITMGLDKEVFCQLEEWRHLERSLHANESPRI
jgi:hypothetical protein